MDDWNAFDVRLADRYIAGACTAEEEAQIEQFATRDPERWGSTVALAEAFRHRARHEAPSSHAARERLDVQLRGALSHPELWRQADTHADSAKVRRSLAGRAMRRVNARQPYAFIRAGSAIIAVFAVAFAQLRPTLHAPKAYRAFSTSIGQRGTLRLPDGSVALLAPGATVRYSNKFGTSDRCLELIGEALFTVPHRTTAAFVVQTGTTVTRVLGTTFSVRYNTGDPTVQVSVTSGRVTVNADDGHHRPATVSAGEVATVTDSAATISTIGNATQYTAWDSGRLLFRNTTVPVVLETLGRWYGRRIYVADSTLVQQHVTAAFDAKSLESALNTLKLVLEADMTVTGELITFRPRRLPAAPTRRVPRELNPSFTEVGR